MKFDILWVGKFDFRKQFGLALRSVAAMKNGGKATLHVVAPMDEVQRKRIEESVRHYGLENRIILYGRVTNARVHELMRRSNVFLFTSLSEGTPHVILEAIKNRLPIVCFDICGHGEVVDETIGIIIGLSDPEKSAAAFATALDRLYDDRASLRQMSANCLDKQRQCAWSHKASNVIGIYKQISKDG